MVDISKGSSSESGIEKSSVCNLRTWVGVVPVDYYENSQGKAWKLANQLGVALPIL